MKSMTGYGSAEGVVGKGRMFVEIRSVNHRYSDVQLKIPPKMNSLDPLFRDLIKNNIERGKIELFLKEKRGITESRTLTLDVSLARKYLECLKQLESELGVVKKDLHLLEIVDAKELIFAEDLDVDYSKYWGAIKQIVTKALERHTKMRMREGLFIMKDQKTRLKKISSAVQKISKYSEQSIKRYQVKAKARIERGFVGQTVPKDRMDSELSAIIDKLDIAEEITRLGSHVSQFWHIIGQKDAIGRQLDFLLQEMNREINTIGSKANDANISKCVIDVKSELEKLREQVQNIE